MGSNGRLGKNLSLCPTGEDFYLALKALVLWVDKERFDGRKMRAAERRSDGQTCKPV